MVGFPAFIPDSLIFHGLGWATVSEAAATEIDSQLWLSVVNRLQSLFPG